MRTSRTGLSTGRKAQGFSLLEMVVSLLIVGLFVSLIMVRIDALTGYGDLREAARIVAAEITRTRGEAAYSHAEKILGFDLQKGWIYPIETDSSDETSEKDKFIHVSKDPERLRKITKLRELPKGVTFVDLVLYPAKSLNEGEGRIRFFPNGCTEETMIRLKNEKDEFYTLEVLAFNGEVIVYDRNVEIKEQKQRVYPVRDHSLSGAHFNRPSERL